MATVVESLIVELGLDPKNFTKGQKDAAASFLKTKSEANRVAKEMEESGKKAAQFFSKLRTEALALFAAFKIGGGIKSFVEAIIGGDAQLGRMAQQLGISAQELATWQNAVEMVGGTAEGATQSLSALTSELEQYRLTGQMGQALQVFNRLGIDIYQSNGQLKTAGQLFREFNTHVQALLRTDPRAARELLRMLGADQGMANLLLQTTDAFNRLYTAASRNTPSETQIAAAQRMQQTWHQLDQALTSLGRTIVNDFGPAVLKVIGWMERWIEKNRGWLESKIQDGVKALGQALKDVPWGEIGQAVLGFASAIGSVHAALAATLGTKGEVEAFLGLWIGSKILAAVAGIGSLAVALNALSVPLKLLTAAGAVINTLIAAGGAGVAGAAAAPGAVTAGAVAALTTLKGDTADIPPEMMAKYKSGEAHASVFGYLGDLFKSTFGRGDGATINNNSNSAQTVINGPIIIQAQGADAKSVYVDLVDTIKQRGLATQGNRGPN